MTIGAPLGRRFLFFLLAFSLAGCSQFKRSSLEEEKDPYYMEGKKRASAMDWDGAIQSFERALQSDPNNAAAHLELGLLYDRQKNDYVSAIYHYQHHLTLRTNSPVADVVKQNITGCARELAKTVSYAVVTSEVQRDLERLSQTNSMLKQRVETLQAELSRRPLYVTNYVTNWATVPQFEKHGRGLTQPAQQVPPPSDHEESVSNTRTLEPVPIPSETASHSQRVRPSPSNPRTAQRSAPASNSSGRSPIGATSTASTSGKAQSTHTVKPGQTLAAVASMYGIDLKDLKAANPAAANGVHAGQKIIIPAR
jgi:LysM repeat protein